MNTFDYFLQITKIPRPSFKEEKIADYLVDFAKANGFDFYRDEINDVIIYKNNGSDKSVILQAHIDMVCEKDADVEFDFDTCDINTYIEGDYIKARGTTLGADDGSGVAVILYALTHFGAGYPNIEAVFTVQEEVTMAGAKAIDFSKLKSNMVVGLDSTESNHIVVSCAGSYRIVFQKPFDVEKVKCMGYECSISNLLGGHSGEDINLNRANANKVIFEFLKGVVGVRLSKASGGNKDNAIPRDAKCSFICDDKNIKSKFEEFKLKLKEDYPLEEPCFELNECEIDTLINKQNGDEVMQFINEFQNGVLVFSDKMPLASINLASIHIVDNQFVISTMFRMNKMEYEKLIYDNYEPLSKKFKAQMQLGNFSPYFECNGSQLEKICVKTYEALFKETPNIVNIHAGLEGGVFAGKRKDLQVVDLGADLMHIHSPKETMKISSLEKISKWVSAILLDYQNSK